MKKFHWDPGLMRLLSWSIDGALTFLPYRRNFKSPVAEAQELYNRYYGTDCAFSPDNRLLLTGTHIKKEGEGKLKFFDSQSLEMVTEVSYPGLSVIRCHWHPKLNQIAVGLSNGDIKFYFDRELR